MMTLEAFQIEEVDCKKFEDKKISLILSTFRQGPKFELLFECLSKQTVKNFELVISDYLFKTREDYVQKLAQKYNIPTIHIGRDKLGGARAFNLGIANSSGDYIMSLYDCTYHPHKWIEKHMLICSNNFLSLGTRYFTYNMDFPIQNYLTGEVTVPEKADPEISKEIERCSNIKDYLHIKFGENQITSPWDFRLLGIPKDLITRDNIIINAMPGWTYGGNIAAPTELFLSINGYDERFDEGFGWSDCELGIRASNKGYKSFINTSNWFLEIQDKDHDNVFEFIPSINNKESYDHNWKLYEEICDKCQTWSNPSINLREIRKEILEFRKE